MWFCYFSMDNCAQSLELRVLFSKREGIFGSQNLGGTLLVAECMAHKGSVWPDYPSVKCFSFHLHMFLSWFVTHYSIQKSRQFWFLVFNLHLPILLVKLTLIICTNLSLFLCDNLLMHIFFKDGHLSIKFYRRNYPIIKYYLNSYLLRDITQLSQIWRIMSICFPLFTFLSFAVCLSHLEISYGR